MRLIVAFGLNDDGQCGSKKRSFGSPSIVKIPLHIVIKSISAGSRHSLALSENGYVFSWGWGLLGQLGHGRSDSVDIPTVVSGLSDICAISAGGVHSACLDKDGQCYTWGSNSFGQLGTNDKDDKDNCRYFPSKVSFLDDNNNEFYPSLRRVSAGGMHTVVVASSGEVYAWGRCDSGQVGSYGWYINGFAGRRTPQRIEGLESPIEDVSCGGFHTLLLDKSGNAFSLGKDDFGVLGIGHKIQSKSRRCATDIPTQVSHLHCGPLRHLSAGGWHSAFLSVDGRLFTCGKGEYGRLGLGDESSRDAPREVFSPLSHHSTSHPTDSIPHPTSFFTMVSSGGSHTLLVDAEGEIFAMGRPDDGRLALPSLSSMSRVLRPHQISNFHRAANEDEDCNDSRSRIYDLNNYEFSPFLSIPGAQVLQIEAGGSHSLVLLEALDDCRDDLLLLSSSPV